MCLRDGFLGTFLVEKDSNTQNQLEKMLEELPIFL